MGDNGGTINKSFMSLMTETLLSHFTKPVTSQLTSLKSVLISLQLQVDLRRRIRRCSRVTRLLRHREVPGRSRAGVRVSDRASEFVCVEWGGACFYS